jgi:hypothetical protein
MLSEWSAECFAEDPVLVVPWDTDPNHPDIGQFINLRENPYDLDRIPEAEQHPPLMQALRSLNAPRSPVFTAKCDVWLLDADERSALQFELGLNDEQSTHGFASYIDLLWRERAIFVSFHQQEQRLTRLTRLTDQLEHPDAALDCILRPAFLDLTGPQEGFAFTVYLKALGTDAAHAYENWSRALEAVTTLLRSKDFSGS